MIIDTRSTRRMHTANWVGGPGRALKVAWSAPSDGILIIKNGGGRCVNRSMAENDLAWSKRHNNPTMRNTPSILVAGKSGQLARALAAVASERKLSFVAIERPGLDLSDAGSIDRSLNSYLPRAIINAAAYTFVDKAESEPDLAFKINRDGAAHLARVAGRLSVPFIHVSTDYVFDGSKATPYQEDDHPFPLGVYGRSKRDGEIAVLDSYPSATILRTSWVYSPYGHNFVKTMLRLAETRERIQVVDDQHGAPTYARDLAQAILEIIGQIEERPEKKFGGIYHLTAAGKTTWYGFASAIFAGWAARGRKIPIVEAITTADYPTPVRRPSNSQLDCSKAAHVFGVRLRPWRQALDSCLDELFAGEMSTMSC
jgi:dTDP-4-dehydrorhamnose reductase